MRIFIEHPIVNNWKPHTAVPVQWIHFVKHENKVDENARTSCSLMILLMHGYLSLIKRKNFGTPMMVSRRQARTVHQCDSHALDALHLHSTDVLFNRFPPCGNKTLSRALLLFCTFYHYTEPAGLLLWADDLQVRADFGLANARQITGVHDVQWCNDGCVPRRLRSFAKVEGREEPQKGGKPPRAPELWITNELGFADWPRCADSDGVKRRLQLLLGVGFF